MAIPRPPADSVNQAKKTKPRRTFVEDHVVPLPPLERPRVLHGELVRRYDDVLYVRLGPARAELLPLLGVSVVAEHLEAGAEPLELDLPVHEAGSRHDDQVRAPDALVGGEVGKHGYCLQRLPETGQRRPEMT